jgi:hypothetical protein
MALANFAKIRHNNMQSSQKIYWEIHNIRILLFVIGRASTPERVSRTSVSFHCIQPRRVAIFKTDKRQQTARKKRPFARHFLIPINPSVFRFVSVRRRRK